MEKAQFKELNIVEKKPNGEEVIRVVTEQKAIEWEVRKFYWNLYQEEEKEIDKEEILRNIAQFKKVSVEDGARMDREITEDEVSETLKNTRNNVAPGSGGFGGSFYKVFWKFLKTIVVRAINEIYVNEELPITLRLGIIALIPKGDKDQRFINNWRPLTLLETLYKLISAKLANRLKPTLDKII